MPCFDVVHFVIVQELKAEIGKLNESLENLKNANKTVKDELIEKQQYIEELNSQNANNLKPQLELKTKELRDAQAKEKVRMICVRIYCCCYFCYL